MIMIMMNILSQQQEILLQDQHKKIQQAKANLVKKADFGDKLKNLIKKITSNKKKHVIAKNELKS